MSHNILNDISAVYVAEVLGPKIKAGGDGEGKKVEKGGTSEEASAKRVRQAVYDIRYRARREGIELAQAFSQYTGKSSMTGQEKTAVKEKLGLAEEVEAIQEAEGSYGATPKAYSAASKTKMTAKRKPFLKKMKSRTNPANRTSPYDSPRKGMTSDDRERARAGATHGVGTRQDHDYPSQGAGGVTKNPKKLRKQKAMGEFSKEEFEFWVNSLVEEGYDLSEHTWDDMLDIYLDEAEGQKYQVRVRDKESGKTYVRYATREKIAQLRANPNISSVEMTKYGKPYEGEKERGEYTSKVKAGKGLDPVGREDKDIDNDGDHDKTDKYLLNRRKVRGNAIATRKEEHEVPDKNLKSLVSKASKRLDADVDGDVDKDDPKSGPMGAFVPSPDGKKRVYAGKVKSEGFYSWRDSLNEIADEMDDKKRKIKEKKIENKIKINPTLGESIENLGGKLLDSEEFVGIFEEVEDVDLYHIDEELIENVLIEFYEEILEEGYDLLEVRKEIIETLNIEMALLDEATVTYGHDTDTKGLKRSKMDSMKSAVKKAYKKGKEAYDSPSGKRVRKKVKRGLYRIAKRVSNVADRAAQRLMDVGEAVTQMPGRETTPPSGTTAKQDDVQVKQKDEALRKQMLAKKKQMMMKQQMLDRQRLQAQQQGKLPMGQHEEVEHLSEDEYRRMLAKERQAERESEKEFRTKGKVGEKKSGPKLSSTKRSAVAGKDYADSQMGSIKIHDKASKGKHTIGSPFSEEVEDIEEKALSKAQQRFMGMVYATKKGDMPAPSAAVAKAAASMTGKEAKDFAKTKHKGLPEKKVAKEEFELWVNALVEEGYDLSDYTWDEMYEFYLDEDAGIVSGLVGLALGAKGAYHAAKKTKRMRDYPKNFVKGIADPRTYVPKKKKEQKEEFEIEEGMTLKDFKANRRKIKRREASADAKKRGHVGKEWYNSGRTYSPDEAKSGRANMQDHERSTRHRSAVDPEGEDSNYSADKTKNPKKLRKQKAMGEDFVTELNRAEKETGINTKTGRPTQKGGAKDDKAFTSVKKMIRGMEGTPAGQRKKEPGKKPPVAGQYGAPKSPAQKVAMRRAAAQRSQDNMSSRYD